MLEGEGEEDGMRGRRDPKIECRDGCQGRENTTQR